MVQRIWKDFLVIYKILCSHTTLRDQEVYNLTEKIDIWLINFLDVYQTKIVTPYIHLLSSHIPEFVRKYGTIAPFSQQCLERLNDLITTDYFRSTNHRDTLRQIMSKLNRLEELGDKNVLEKS